jgi:hypothetical protein
MANTGAMRMYSHQAVLDPLLPPRVCVTRYKPPTRSHTKKMTTPIKNVTKSMIFLNKVSNDQSTSG